MKCLIQKRKIEKYQNEFQIYNDKEIKIRKS